MPVPTASATAFLQVYHLVQFSNNIAQCRVRETFRLYMAAVFV